MRKYLFLTVILFLSACAGRPIVIERIPFDLAEYSSLPSQGTASITGQAYIKLADGSVRYPDNAQARLNPVTSYSKQWYQVHYLDRLNITSADPRYLEYVRKVKFDEQGRFSFENIPAGNYYISAPIFWMEEIKLADGSILMKRQGAFVCYEIQVEKGQQLVMNITQERAFNVASSD